MPIDVAATGQDGVLGLPTDINRAGWWNGSSRLGDPYGVIVVAAHVDSFSQGIGPFAELLGMRPGRTIRLAGRDHGQRFRVASVSFQPRTSLPERTSAFTAHGDRRLVLITCGGPYDVDRGGYRDNLIVMAAPLGGLHPLGR